MARKPIPEKKSIFLSITQVQAAIPKVRRRLQELSALNIDQLNNDTGEHVLDSYSQKINATIREIYGVGTVEGEEFSIESFRPNFMFYYEGIDTSIRGNIDVVRDKVRGGIAKLTTLLEILEEQAGGADGDAKAQVVRAYEGLDLHPEISRASSTLYQHGHYANAVEAAVKALNGLVRLRSGLEHDGTTLMERAFSPSNPVLKFNDFLDQSDRDEQKGFMYLFSGAVAGLRNPRAHGFVEDDAERALEFIAFVSLLAKLLDGAKA